MGVEIDAWAQAQYDLDASCPARGMGVEIGQETVPVMGALSCPARGMGVEIKYYNRILKTIKVMPREGHGSRNRNTADCKILH